MPPSGRFRLLAPVRPVTVRSARMDQSRVTETIRVRLKRRKRRSLAVAGIGFGAMTVAVAVAYMISRPNRALLTVAVLGLAILSGGLLYLSRARCPNCLGRSGAVLYARETNFCPQCGVSLDTPAR
jgi:hypothetical protein